MNLRCKDGDLAVVVGDFPGCEGNIGRLVQVKGPVRTPRQYPLPCWRIKPINRRGWLIAENDWAVTKEVVIWRSGIIHPDCWLLPIRPTDDGQDIFITEKALVSPSTQAIHPDKWLSPIKGKSVAPVIRELEAA